MRYGFGNRDNIGGFQFFIAAYAMLDLIGYKPDKLSKASLAMNSVNTDAKHAFFAAFCDYFVTQDAHLTCKARSLSGVWDFNKDYISFGSYGRVEA